MDQIAQIVPRFSSARIVVLGDVMLDRLVFGEVRRISPEAPIPVFRISRQEHFAGGAGNVARNIASLGGTAVLVGVIGDGDTGALLKKIAGETGGFETRLTADASRPTTVKTRYFAQNQQLFRVDEEETHPVSPEVQDAIVRELAEALDGADILLISDYAKGLLTPALLAEAIGEAKRRDVPIVVDPKSKDLGIYKGASAITPNALEAQQATGIDCGSNAGAAEAARAIAATVGCKTVLVTRGEQGITILSEADNGGRLTHLPTAAREVFDVSGAGDVVAAAFSLGSAVELPAEDAANLANLAAGIAVTKIGTFPVLADELLQAGAAPGDRPDGARIVDARTAAEQTRKWQERGETVVFTNGCFDLLHPGHVSLLASARAQGDRLIVALNSDASVKRLKGEGRPVQNEASRCAVMAAVGSVDLVTTFSEDTPMELMRAIRPDVIVKGNDYTVDQVVGADFVQSYGGRVVLAALEEGHSTSELVRKASGPDGSG